MIIKQKKPPKERGIDHFWEKIILSAGFAKKFCQERT